MNKLKIERDALESYRERIRPHTLHGNQKSEVDMIETKEDGKCLGFTYIDVNSVLVYIYYHEPSLCYCIHKTGDTPRELTLIPDY